MVIPVCPGLAVVRVPTPAARPGPRLGAVRPTIRPSFRTMSFWLFWVLDLVLDLGHLGLKLSQVRASGFVHDFGTNLGEFGSRILKKLGDPRPGVA